MLRKIVFKADRKISKVARYAYKNMDVDCFVVHVLDKVADISFNFACLIVGMENMMQMQSEYVMAEREKAIANGTYIGY